MKKKTLFTDKLGKKKPSEKILWKNKPSKKNAFKKKQPLGRNTTPLKKSFLKKKKTVETIAKRKQKVTEPKKTQPP